MKILGGQCSLYYARHVSVHSLYTEFLDCRQMLTYGRRIPLTEFDYRIQQVDAKTIREVCTRYLYDKCPVIVGIGTSVLCSQVHVLCIYDDLFGQESVSLSSVSDCVCVCACAHGHVYECGILDINIFGCY